MDVSNITLTRGNKLANSLVSKNGNPIRGRIEDGSLREVLWGGEKQNNKGLLFVGGQGSDTKKGGRVSLRVWGRESYNGISVAQDLYWV